MDAYLLQEWTTVQGFEPTILSVTQPSALWLDLGHARDLTFSFESVNKYPFDESRTRSRWNGPGGALRVSRRA